MKLLCSFFSNQMNSEKSFVFISSFFVMHGHLKEFFLKSNIYVVISALYIYIYLDVALAFECGKGNSRHETQVDSIVHVMLG